MKLLTPAFIVCALLGCSATSMDKAGTLYGEQDQGLVRIDVHPPPDFEGNLDSDGSAYLAHTLTVDTSVRAELEITIQKSVRVHGVVTGWELSPWLSPSLPGEENAIEASMSIVKPDTAQSYYFSTNEDGHFETWVVPNEEYLLTINPDSAGSVFSTQTLSVPNQDEYNLDLQIGYGQTVWGRVLNSNGLGVEDVGIFAADIHGNHGKTTLTNDLGYYSLRVDQGDYYINSVGRTNQSGRDPVLQTMISAVDAEDIRADLYYPNLTNFAVGGKVLDEAGRGLGDIDVRFISTSLTDYDIEDTQATVDVSVTTNSYGNFDTRLIPGDYEMWILPPDGVELSSYHHELITVNSELNLGQTVLPAMVEVTGFIEDDLGMVPGARLQCAEDNPSGRYWSTIASQDPDELGQYLISLPQTPVDCIVSPPGGRPQLAISRLHFNPSDDLMMDIAIPTGTEIIGTAITDEGAAVPFALIQVYSMDGELLGTAVTDAGGLFSLSVELGDTGTP